MQEDLESKESIQFPAVINISTNDPLPFDGMTPMIEIPTSIVLRQLEEGTYIDTYICMYLYVFAAVFIAMHYNVTVFYGT